jgi:glucokinase
VAPTAPDGLVAVDMGGSFLKYGIVVASEPDHATLELTFVRMPMSDTPERTPADALADAVRSALQAADRIGVAASGIGVCSPGPFDWQRGISRMTHKLRSIEGVDLRAAVAARVPHAARLGMRFVPDSLAFAAGELGFGAARGFPRCLYVMLGTGIGSALSEGSRILLQLPGKSPDGAIWDAPYRDGITEDYVSKRALLATYARLRRPASASVAAELDAADIGELARAGDPTAIAAFREFGRHLGAALRCYAFEFRPACVVIGGGLRPCFPYLEHELREELDALPGLERIAVSQLGDRGPLLGIAATYAEGYREP